MFIPADQIWIVAVGFVIAFILAFGIGANDVANSFGTSVGSKVISLRKACILASIFEVLGSVLIGAQVSDTIRKGVISPEDFVLSNTTNITKVMMLGQLSSLTGACIWLLVATFFKLPVSGSHSIVGAMLGYSLVAQGPKKIQWIKLGLIVASWFISPIVSGTVSIFIFFMFDRLILRKRDPLEPGLRLLPFIYGITVFINVFSIFLSGPKLLMFDKVPLYGNFIISFAMLAITALIVRFAIVPYLRKRILWMDYLNAGKRSKTTNQSDRKMLNSRTSEDGNVIHMKNLNPNLGIRFQSKQHPPGPRVVRRVQNVNDINTHLGRRMLLKQISEEREMNNTKSSNPNSRKVNEMDLNIGKHNPNVNRKTRNDSHLGDQSSHRLLSNQTSEESNRTNMKQMNSNSRKVSRPDMEISDHSRNRSSNEGSMKTNNSNDRDQPAKKAVNSRINEESESIELKNTNSNDREIDDQSSKPNVIHDKPEQVVIFSWLQILTAIFGSFAHGGNDVSNAIGPLVGLWILAVTQDVNSSMDVPVWILLYGGIGITVGLWIWGRRVMKTIGTELTTITPSSGVSIELGSAITVLIASNIGIPISSTHCKVGSIVSVGRFRSNDNVDWKVFGNIMMAWLITLPFSAGISALVMYLLSLLK